ncbi:MAG: 2-dehydro-3-deoxygalactonokinase [Clostridia bacterium]|nr:2-dehydro-3-deoxygalactonokinase [Clostridia bacterium]
MIIAIDGGTTNTRLTLMDGRRVLDRRKLRVGARNTVRTGSSSALSEAVRDGIADLLAAHNLREADIAYVTASGMITSESGLYELSHIVAPVGVNELRAGCAKVSLPEIAAIPFLFIPGVKTFSDASSAELASMDIMRGEETELIGLISEMNLPNVTALMPGSHLKIVDIADGKIISFRTSISGELSRAAAENTILASSLGSAFPHVADPDYLRAGFDYAEAHGINEALFKVRVQANFVRKANADQLYAFLMGAILRDDVRSILSGGSETLLAAGSDPFRSALVTLLEGSNRSILTVPEALAEDAAAIGAAVIAEGL